MIRRPPRSTQGVGVSSAASDVYKRQQIDQPDSFFSLFFGIFGNDFSWGKNPVLYKARARARARAQQPRALAQPRRGPPSAVPGPGAHGRAQRYTSPLDTPRGPSGARGGFLFVLSSVTEVPQKFWALFPAFGLPIEGFEVKSTPRGPRFRLFWAEMLSKSVSGTARTLCSAWQLALRLRAPGALTQASAGKKTFPS